jgi:hypothetical protein
MTTTKNIVRLAKEFVVKVHDMVIARCTDFSFTIDKKLIDVTSFDTESFDEFVADNKNWSISFGSMVTREGTLGEAGAHGATGLGSGTWNNLFDHMVSDASDYAVTIGLGDELGATGSYWEGPGILNNLTMDGAVGDKMTYAGNIQGSGKITRE